MTGDDHAPSDATNDINYHTTFDRALLRRKLIKDLYAIIYTIHDALPIALSWCVLQYTKAHCVRVCVCVCVHGTYVYECVCP